MVEVFDKYNKYLIRNEYKKFYPKFDRRDINKENTTISFKLDYNNNCFLNLKNIHIYIEGEYKQTDEHPYGDKATVKLINNFVAHKFKTIEYKKHNYKIDLIENVGVASTMKGVITKTKTDTNNLNTGFISNFEHGGIFTALVPLSDLGLGICDTDNIIWGSADEFIFTMNNDNDAIYRANDVAEGKIIITDIYLYTPLLEYDTIGCTMLLDELKTLSEEGNYILNYYRWQCIKILNESMSGKSLKLDITTDYRSHKQPLFGIFAFQVNKSNDQLKDMSEFNHKYVKNYYFTINGNRYPEESQNLNFDKNKYNIAYMTYQSYKKIFSITDKNMFYDIKSYKEPGPVYLVDLTCQPTDTEISNKTIFLHVDLDKEVKKDTCCYIILLSHIKNKFDMVLNKFEETL